MPVTKVVKFWLIALRTLTLNKVSKYYCICLLYVELTLIRVKKVKVHIVWIWKWLANCKIDQITMFSVCLQDVVVLARVERDNVRVRCTGSAHRPGAGAVAAADARPRSRARQARRAYLRSAQGHVEVRGPTSDWLKIIFIYDHPLTTNYIILNSLSTTRIT